MRLAPGFAGTFYPTHAEEIEVLIEDAIAAVEAREPAPWGLLVPHAGYVYSGIPAARAYARARAADPDTVVVLGPSHRVWIEGAAVLEAEAFETPYGALLTDADLGRRIAETLTAAVPGAGGVPAFCEHSLEVQLPFVRRLWPRARAVLVAFGPGDLVLAEALAAFLDHHLEDENLLLVASSDLSHEHAQPEAQILDARFEELFVRADPAATLRAIAEGITEACGVGPVLTLQTLARRRGCRPEVVDRRDSSHAFGQTDRVVGYLSAVVGPPLEAGRK